MKFYQLMSIYNINNVIYGDRYFKIINKKI